MNNKEWHVECIDDISATYEQISFMVNFTRSHENENWSSHVYLTFQIRDLTLREINNIYSVSGASIDSPITHYNNMTKMFQCNEIPEMKFIRGSFDTPQIITNNFENALSYEKIAKWKNSFKE